MKNSYGDWMQAVAEKNLSEITRAYKPRIRCKPEPAIPRYPEYPAAMSVWLVYGGPGDLRDHLFTSYSRTPQELSNAIDQQLRCFPHYLR